MSRMTPQSQKKRRLEDGIKGKTSRPKKKIRKQEDYHSSEDEESDAAAFETGLAPKNLQDQAEAVVPTGANAISNTEPPPPRKTKLNQTKSKPSKKSLAEDSSNSDSASSDDKDDDDDDEEENEDLNPTNPKPRTKRNDPEAFSTSITKILSTKLPTSTRSDPVLSRSTSTHATNTNLNASKLESRAKHHLRLQRKADLSKNRVTDILGLENGNAGEVAAEEKRLRKIAQRGVVKLFNAVRAAQVRAEEVNREERERGLVGRKEREERAKEMSREGFLELIGAKGMKGKEGVE